VDDQNAPLLQANQPAAPFSRAARRVSCRSAERVDTRVLQIIYKLDVTSVRLYVGQQVDVFINRPWRLLLPNPFPRNDTEPAD
jgi:hypothetical protein